MVYDLKVEIQLRFNLIDLYQHVEPHFTLNKNSSNSTLFSYNFNSKQFLNLIIFEYFQSLKQN